MEGNDDDDDYYYWKQYNHHHYWMEECRKHAIPPISYILCLMCIMSSSSRNPECHTTALTLTWVMIIITTTNYYHFISYRCTKLPMSSGWPASGPLLKVVASGSCHVSQILLSVRVPIVLYLIYPSIRPSLQPPPFFKLRRKKKISLESTHHHKLENVMFNWWWTMIAVSATTSLAWTVQSILFQFFPSFFHYLFSPNWLMVLFTQVANHHRHNREKNYCCSWLLSTDHTLRAGIFFFFLGFIPCCYHYQNKQNRYCNGYPIY